MWKMKPCKITGGIEGGEGGKTLQQTTKQGKNKDNQNITENQREFLRDKTKNALIYYA